MKKLVAEIEKHVYSCFKEIADHTMQSEILSPQIKTINEDLKSMSKIIEEMKEHPSLEFTITRGPALREKKPDEEKEDLIKIAYGLSRFGHEIINDVARCDFNQGETFKYLSNRKRVKVNTLKNYRDMFDPYVRQEKSNRKGWHQKELPPSFMQIKELWDDLDYSEIKELISDALDHHGKIIE